MNQAKPPYKEKEAQIQRLGHSYVKYEKQTSLKNGKCESKVKNYDKRQEKLAEFVHAKK